MDRSQEETLQQERCARGVAWNLSKNLYKLKNADQATFLYIPIEVLAMLAPTSKRPQERAFVVDSGASMHMLSKKVLTSDELDTLRHHSGTHCQRRSAQPRGSTSTRSRSKCIRDSAITRRNACCSIAWKKLCEDHGYSYQWVSGRKTLPTQVVQALKSRSGCKNSEKIWWMMKFQNMETLTPVLVMNYL